MWRPKKNILTCLFLWLSLASQAVMGNIMEEADVKQFREAQTLQQEGSHFKAIQSFQTLFERYPTMGDLPRLMAHSYFELAQLDRARQMSIEALALGRFSTDMLVRLMQIDQQRNDELASLNTVRLLTITDPKNQQWRQHYAMLLANNHHHAQAAQVYRQLIKQQADQPMLWQQLAGTLHKQQQIDQAINALQTAWFLGQQSPIIASQLVGLTQQAGDTEATLHWLETLINLSDQPDPIHLFHKAQRLIELHRFQEAQAIAQSLLTHPKSNDTLRKQAHLLLGHLASRKPDFDQALSHWEAAHHLGHSDPTVLLTLGKLKYNQKKYDQAIRYLQKYRQYQTPDRATMWLTIRCALQTKQPATIQTTIEQYIESFGIDDQIKQAISQYVEQD